MAFRLFFFSLRAFVCAVVEEGILGHSLIEVEG